MRAFSRAIITLSVARQSSAFTPISRLASKTSTSFYNHNTRMTHRFMSSGGMTEPPQITQIGKDGLQEIIEDIEYSSRAEAGYVVIDVRNVDEIAYTGKLSECVETLPLPVIAQMGAFNMEPEDFEASFGFEKPGLDETIVFTCKAGIRSMHAGQLAGMAGYQNIVNYSGGAMDWFQ
mmetsp:Transcript_28389/g.35109  ORF Transcript_28389/g.35109 Transcript_28389/m.35109 type:complete len:177 (-) Transcript_28389:138-668(-)